MKKRLLIIALMFSAFIYMGCQIEGLGEITATDTGKTECGNGVLDAGEACDSFGQNTTTCNANCTAPVCGDGHVNDAVGEKCDDGNTINEENCDYGEAECTRCGSQCKVEISLTGSYCGDGVWDEANGEQCDDGNTSSTDSCTVECITVIPDTPVCGDGQITGTEVCDDGNNVNEENCDYGTATCETCNADCSAPLSLTGEYCGDLICNGPEDSSSCVTECPVNCGNGTLDEGEICDDGNTTEETECAYGTSTCTTCNSNCTAELNLTGDTCGDGVTNGPEVCDDGNTVTETNADCPYGTTCTTFCNDTCSTQLTLTGASCGDGTCDSADGETTASCAGDCPAAGVCGDGTQDTGEACDDGNTTTEVACSYGTATCETCNADCSAPLSLTGEYCGDSVCTASAGEDNVTCAVDCPVVCGNSVVESGEACDDGNTASNDGCSSTCQFDTDTMGPAFSNIYYTGTGSGTSGAFVAGDTITMYADVTDFSGISFVNLYVMGADFSSTAGYCTAALVSGNTYSCTLTIPAGFVPNGTETVVPYAEDTNFTYEAYVYNTANSTTYYSTDATYLVTDIGLVFVPMEAPPAQVCGNGTVEGTETCDDGNTTSNDGCSAACQFDTDTTPPTYSNIYYTGTGSGAAGAFLQGDSITMYADVTDFSGISSVTLYIVDADIMNIVTSCSASLVSGNTYSCAITVPAGYIPNGTEHILPFANDTFGYADYLYYNTAMSSTYYTLWNAGTVTTTPIVFVPMDVPAQVCGDGVVAGSEQCDDGNTTAGDGCNSTCQMEFAAGGAIVPGNVTGSTAYGTSDYTTFLHTNTGEFFTFTANGTSSYAVLWDDSYSGSGAYTGDILMIGTNSAGTQIIYQDSGYLYPAIITPIAGTVTLETNPYYSAGTVGINVLPYNTITVNGGWYSYNLPVTSGSILIAFSVTSGQTCTVNWDDSYEGTGTYSGDIWMAAYQGNPGATPYFNLVDSGYYTGQTFTATATGTVYLEANANWSSGSLGVSVSCP
ncbi:MAG: DUF4215 domain-containing protein [Spirochaetia bacterium]|nr:DUF4215 domain-containing protein [Spirochaetia bacterium]